MEINGTALSIIAGLASTLFIGYCFYFDRKRRNAVDFKKKLHARRQSVLQNSQNENIEIPVFDPNNTKAMDIYCLQEIQIGERMISCGNMECGVQHLVNALYVCSQPNHLLQLLEITLPSEIFSMFLMKAQEIGNRPGKYSQDNPNIKISLDNRMHLIDTVLKTENTIIDDQLE